MCIAILNTPNVTFSKSLIRNCWDNNGDGAGLIYTNTKKKTLHTFKELDSVEKYYAKYIEVRRKHPKSKIVLHFRISTSGGVNIQNTHPFSVNDALAFVHNGVISELNGIDKNRSDTNLFNEQVLKNLPAGFERSETIAKLIGKYIGHSKLVFLNALNESTIVNSNLGQSDPAYVGCWFSNSTYKPTTYYDYGGTKVYKKFEAQTTYPKAWQTPQLPATHSKTWQSGASWDRDMSAWRLDSLPTKAQAPKKEEVKPVRYWSNSLQDWDDEAEEIYYQKQSISTTLSPAEEMRLAYLRSKHTNTMTAKEWEELNNLELLTQDF